MTPEQFRKYKNNCGKIDFKDFFTVPISTFFYTHQDKLYGNIKKIEIFKMLQLINAIGCYHHYRFTMLSKACKKVFLNHFRHPIAAGTVFFSFEIFKSVIGPNLAKLRKFGKNFVIWAFWPKNTYKIIK